MRNLSLWKTSTVSLTEAEFSAPAIAATAAAEDGGTAGTSTLAISAVAVDLDHNALFLTTERRASYDDGEASVSVWRIANEDDVRADRTLRVPSCENLLTASCR